MKQDKLMKEFNDSILQLGTDISKAINNYLKREYINFASIVGILEDTKFNVMDMSRRLNPGERVIFQKKPPEYIG